LRLKFPDEFELHTEKYGFKTVQNPQSTPLNCRSKDKNPWVTMEHKNDSKKKADDYREQLLIFHPDKNSDCIKDAHTKFLLLQQLYEKGSYAKEEKGGRNRKRTNKKCTNRKRTNKKCTNRKRTNKKCTNRNVGLKYSNE
jgi:hypothetical protein